VTFGNPFVLLLLVVPIWLFAWIWRRRSGAVTAPFDRSRARGSRGLRIAVDFAESLPSLLLAIAIVLLANPQRFSEPRTRREMTNIEFCVDISGSMTAEFGEGTRYDGAMKAIDGFLDKRKGDAFGLTFFGNNVMHWVPLTNDVTAIRCSPPFMRPEVVPPWFGGTMIGKALMACRDVLRQREQGDRMLVLVSDGESGDFGNGYETEVAEALRRDNITLYCIHTAEYQTPDDIVNIAAATGGAAFQADDPAALEEVFQRIDAMQVTKIEKIAAETLDDFAMWSWIGMSLSALALLCGLGLRYTPW
jgi:Ca-activated chloride channel family protein